MLYFYFKELDNPAFEGIIPVFLSTSKGVTTAQILSNSNLFQQLALDVAKPVMTWLPDYSAPIITFSATETEETNVTNLTSVMQLIADVRDKNPGIDLNADAVKNKFISIVSSRYTEKEATFFVNLCISQLAYEQSGVITTPINLNVDLLDSGDFAVVTRNKLNEHNQQFRSVFSSISDAENVTVYQNACTDPLFIEIPSYESLITDDSLNYNDIIPKRALVCTPYDDKNAYSPKYKISNVSNYLIPLIEGDRNNNNLEIQENEQKYYNALLEWVEHNIKQEYGMDGSIIDNVSKQYLTELTNRLYAWHWSHNPAIPTSFLAENDDSDSGDSVSSKYVFEQDINDDTNHGNALVALESFLESASASLGYKVYIEAAVKLARWGTRKGTALAIANYPYVLDLATNTVKRDIGSISDYKIKSVNGSQYKLMGFIYPSSTAQDPQLQSVDYSSIPVGLVLKSFYENDKGESLNVPLYCSMFDAIPAIKNGELTVDGLAYDGTGFNQVADLEAYGIQLLHSDYVEHKDDFLQNPFWRSTELTNLCLDFNTGKDAAEHNLLCILEEALKNTEYSSEVKAFHISSLDELRQKVATFEIYSVPAALTVNVASTMFPVLDKVAQGKNEPNILNVWDRALTNWCGVSGFYGKVESAPAAEPSVEPSVESAEPSAESAPVTASSVAAMTSFSNETSAPAPAPAAPTPTTPAPAAPAPTHVSSDMDNVLIREINLSGGVIPITDLNNLVIGAYAKEIITLPNNKQMKRYILLDRDTMNSLPEGSISSNSVCILKIFHYFVKDLERVADGTTAYTPLCFASRESLKYYRKEIKNLCKTIMEHGLK